MTLEDLSQQTGHTVKWREIVQQTHSQGRRACLCVCLERTPRCQNPSALMQLDKTRLCGKLSLTKKPCLLWKRSYEVTQVSGNTAFFGLILTSCVVRTSSCFICLLRSDWSWCENCWTAWWYKTCSWTVVCFHGIVPLIQKKQTVSANCLQVFLSLASAGCAGMISGHTFLFQKYLSWFCWDRIPRQPWFAGH